MEIHRSTIPAENWQRLAHGPVCVGLFRWTSPHAAVKFAGVRRRQLFEFNDQNWFPKSLRRQILELLATVFRITNVYEPTIQTVNELIRRTGQRDLVVLAAGSGSGACEILPRLPKDCKITLTDIFPDLFFVNSDPRIHYDRRRVDARQVPSDLRGARLIYSAFHHFTPENAKALLRDAASRGEAIAVFEITSRTWRGLLAVLFMPFLTFAFTPLIRPWRWARLVWTYLIPIIPLVATWDGLVSCLRTYTREDFEELCRGMSGYRCGFEDLRGPMGTRVSVMTLEGTGDNLRSQEDRL